MPTDTQLDRQAAFLALQREQLPDRERVLCGWENVRAYLSDELRLRRRSGKPLTVRQIRRWRDKYGLPVGAGGALIPGPHGVRRTVCMTTTSALLAWTLAQRIGRFFCVSYPGGHETREG
jgi:hypothetical protein